MDDWTLGYVADINYTTGYYQELNPLRIPLALASTATKCKPIETACELGFGQGLSTNIHAAASEIEWYGTDFNSSQVAFASDLAEASGSGAKLFDDSFEEFFTREDLPDFDFIVLHGVWSWVSEQNRSRILDFIKRKLAVGGVVYLSYNTQPGWSAFEPLRKLLVNHTRELSQLSQPITEKIDSSLAFAQSLMEVNPKYLRDYPLAGPRIEKLLSQNRQYLAHEFFNQEWHLSSFSEVASLLKNAKLSYCCSAHLLDQIPSVNLTDEQQKFLSTIPDQIFRQSVFDFMINQQFRRDYWVKGPISLSPHAQREILKSLRVTLLGEPANVSLTVKGGQGEATLREDVYHKVMGIIWEEEIISLGDLEQALASTNIDMSQILQIVMILVDTGALAIVQEDKAIQAAKGKTAPLNEFLCMQAMGNGDITHLASPVTGGGISVSRFQQLFILAAKEGHKEPQDWAEFAWNILNSQGQKIVKKGEPLNSPEENIRELQSQAKEFKDKRINILSRLSVV